MENSHTTLKRQKILHLILWLLFKTYSDDVLPDGLRSNSESAGNVFVTELQSGRRNCRRADMLQKSTNT